MKFAFPKVAILMATYNGEKWLAAQLESLIKQQGVEISLFISDDFSSDNSYEVLLDFAKTAANVVVLPRDKPYRSAGKNFYRLIMDVALNDYDYIAFSDQDDVWDSDKLLRHIKLLSTHSAEAVSSNVVAFWPDGQRKLIQKSQQQREYDHLFESAGPGCTFLMSPRLLHQLKLQLNNALSPARDVSLHDWLSYALARTLKYTWFIDAKPSVLYRQHGGNVVGANASLKAKLMRLRKMRDGWYRNEVVKVASVAYEMSPSEPLIRLLRLLDCPSFSNRFRLLPYAWHGRRSVKDRLFLMLAIVLGWF